VIYLYGFVAAPVRKLPKRGAFGEPLRVVRLDRLSAVVGRLPEVPAVSGSSLEAQHALDQRLAAGAASFLPARFGMIAESLEDLRRRVSPSWGYRLSKALAKSAGKEQMTVRLVPLRSPARSTRPSRTGTAYLSDRYALAHRKEVSAVRELVRELFGAEKVRFDGRGEMITLYHLIPKGKAGEYRARIDGGWREGSVRVEVGGPYPPFAFAPEILP
jgi:hypothetical protein